MATTWTNPDGLEVIYGTREVENTRPGVVGGVDSIKKLVIDLDWVSVNAGVNPAGSQNFVPAGATVVDCVLKVGTAWAGATATLELGWQQLDGTEIDNNGIDSIAVAALTADTTIVCDGADAANIIVSSTLDAYFAADDATAAFTDGDARLEIRYRLDNVFDSGLTNSAF